MLPATAQQTAKMHENGYTASNGYVPDAATAVKIAEAVLVLVYGEQKIVSERPFTATLKGNFWTVEVLRYALLRRWETRIVFGWHRDGEIVERRCSYPLHGSLQVGWRAVNWRKIAN
jgi:hypothetical protein